MSGEDADRCAEGLRDFGLGGEDLTAWRESGLPDSAFEDWLTDRVARWPSGSRARRVYGAEGVHDFARRAILEALALALGPGDHMLEVGLRWRASAARRAGPAVPAPPGSITAKKWSS